MVDLSFLVCNPHFLNVPKRDFIESKLWILMIPPFFGTVLSILIPLNPPFYSGLLMGLLWDNHWWIQWDYKNVFPLWQSLVEPLPRRYADSAEPEAPSAHPKIPGRVARMIDDHPPLSSWILLIDDHPPNWWVIIIHLLIVVGYVSHEILWMVAKSCTTKRIVFNL